MNTNRIYLLPLILLLLFACSEEKKPDSPVEAVRIRIAAAADLKPALDSFLITFGKKHHEWQIEAVYGSSGKLCEQIRNSAPFDLFFSADTSYPFQLYREGKSLSEPIVYAKGKLVLWSKHLPVNKSGTFVHALTTMEHLAIANPEHAPYGKRAVEFLEFHHLWNDRMKSKTALAENAAQAAQYAASGNADAAIIPLSLALSPAMLAENGKYVVLPEESYSPLLQGCALLKHGAENAAAADLLKEIQGQDFRSILRHFGFEIPAS